MKILAAVTATVFLLVSALLGPVVGAQPLQPVKPMLTINITSLSPRIVDTSAKRLTVEARVTNIADVPVHTLKARLQLGAPQADADELGQALRGAAPLDSQATPFRPVSDRLAPGESVDLKIEADLRGGLDGLYFTEPGEYPLMLNVNGAPEASGEARLAAMNLLLPVRAQPGGTPAKRPEEPQELSVIWPIAAKPRVAHAPVRGSVVLADDILADEIRPGGRLHSLVNAAEQARTAWPELFDSLCFGIDPELVSTVRAMSRGYRVRQGPNVVKGSGRADAKEWLTLLREVVDGRCVLPTAYAGADIPALATRTPALAETAAARESVIEDALGVAPLTGAIWSSGVLTDDALQVLAKADKDVVITNAADLQADEPSATPKSLTSGDGAAGDGMLALPYDELAALALTPGTAGDNLGYPATVAADDASIAAQSAVATILFRARTGDGPLLLAPPQAWQVRASEMQWLLDTLGELQDDGVVDALSLTSLRQSGSSGEVQPAVGEAAAARLPARVASDITSAEATVADLADAIDVDPTEQVDPDVITEPLHDGLLRASSTRFQHNPAARERAMRDAQAQLTSVLEAVRVTDPKRTISLASGSSPIPVLIANRLPVRVTVHVTLASTPGLRPSEVPEEVEIPAGRSRNLRVPAEALRAGRFTVDVQLTTPGGTQLGTPTQFELASTEYGLITVIVTATAAGALLLLSGRRIYRRLKSNGVAGVAARG